MVKILRRTLPTLVLASLAFVSTRAPAAIRWQIQDGGNGHLYEAVAVPGGISWTAANAAAQAAGGYLATVTSQAENDFIFALIDAPQFWRPVSQFNISLGPWIGGFQPPGSPEPAGNWRWVTGESFSYTSWHPGEPSNAGFDGAEHHLNYFASPVGTHSSNWNDSTASTRMFGFVMELDIPPGGSESDPILPGAPGPEPGQWVFPNAPGTGRWFDPIAASSYRYATDGLSNFTDVTLPSGLGDADGVYSIFDSLNGFVQIPAGGSYHFPTPVAEFTVSGIDPTVDGEDPLAFPIFLAFDQATVNFTIEALTDVVPEPTAIVVWGVLGLAIGGFSAQRQKRR